MPKLTKTDYLFFAIFLAILLLNFQGSFSFQYPRVNDHEAHSYMLWYLNNYITEYGKIPQWTSDQFGGRPFLGIYPPAAFFIFFPLIYIMNAPTALVVTMFLAAFIFIVALYFLANYIFNDKFKAFLASVLLSFSPYLFSLSTNPWPQYISMVFVPLTFLAYEKFSSSKNLKYASLVAILIGLTLVTHHVVGATLFGSILFFMIYDYVRNAQVNKDSISEHKKIFYLCFFLVFSVLISLFFLIPAYNIQKTVQFDVVKQAAGGQHTAEKVKPISFNTFFFKTNDTNEYVGIIIFIGVLFSLLSFRKNKLLQKYISLVLILLAVCFYLIVYLPGFMKDVFQWASRIYSLLIFPLYLVAIEGYYNASDFVISLLKKEGVINEASTSSESKTEAPSSKNHLYLIVLVLVLITAYDYYGTKYEPSPIPVTRELANFYSELAKNPEFFRIDDQQVAAFGYTTALHKHGILNGAPSEEAPKYHFFFWSSAWQLLGTDAGKENFASLYGSLSIKYIVSGGDLNISYFKKSLCDVKYCVYENEKFMPHLKLIPTVIAIPLDEPNSLLAALQLLSQQQMPLDKLSIIETKEQVGLVNNSQFSELKAPDATFNVIEQRPGYIVLDIQGVTQPVFLRITDSYHPYWKAYQNDKEIKVYKGIPSHLVIPISENGQVRVVYSVPNKKELFYLSSASFLVLVILYFYFNRKEKRGNKEESKTISALF